MSKEMPEVTEIQRWELRPGDRLIVTVESLISAAQVEFIKENVRAALALPAHMPVLVHGPDVNVEVVNA